ncbi:MAG TPA: 3-methyl-2-oxobutanoate dehydrogenase subunit beta, partial [Flexistipes sinusarabici]|nr:3-methyl-2-oxobutanoate dehydrogenase subunit beta [Flexistipes sinusarabici]
TVHPFPYEELKKAASQSKKILVVEMNRGQMLFDVRLSVQNDEKIDFVGKPGGETFSPEEIENKILSCLK